MNSVIQRLDSMLGSVSGSIHLYAPLMVGLEGGGGAPSIVVQTRCVVGGKGYKLRQGLCDSLEKTGKHLPNDFLQLF